MKKETHINKKIEIEITRSKINLPPEQRAKKVTQIYPPEGTQFKKGKIWCPIRHVVNSFYEYCGLNHCPDCGISERIITSKKNHEKE